MRFHFRWIPLLALQKLDLKRKILESREIRYKGIRYDGPVYKGPMREASKAVFCAGPDSTCSRL